MTIKFRAILDAILRADKSALATCCSVVGLVIMHLQKYEEPRRRRRLFLAAETVQKAAAAGADMLAELGVTAGDSVLIAARSIEATEVAAFCAAIRAESVMIDEPDGSAVAIALSVSPRLFVYDTSIMPSPAVLAICCTLANAGCQCAMLAVAEKADANHAQYSVYFDDIMARSSLDRGKRQLESIARATPVALRRAALPAPSPRGHPAADSSERLLRENRDLRAELANRDRLIELSNPDKTAGNASVPRKFRILVLDGGGMRGVITARLLARLERSCPGFLARADMIVGTSTGSICTAQLARGDKPEDLERLYRAWGPKIFAKPGLLARIGSVGGLAACQFGNKALEQGLNATGFSEMTLGELMKKVLITAFDVDGEPIPGCKQSKRSPWGAKFFHNFVPGDGAVRVKDAVLASTAAPTYFPLYNGFCDGGVVANHPVMPAVAQAVHPAYGGQRLEDLVVLNVGTGEVKNKMDLGSPHNGNARLGVASWIKPLIEILFTGQQECTEFEAQALLGRRFHRISPLLQNAHDPDPWNADVSNIEAMCEIVETMGPAFDRAVEFVQEQWMDHAAPVVPGAYV